MVKEALKVVQHKTPLRVVYIPIKYPVVSEQDLVATFEAELNKYTTADGGGVKLCIFDHVSSMVWRPSRHYPILLRLLTWFVFMRAADHQVSR
jgi:hypothetical protein